MALRWWEKLLYGAVDDLAAEVKQVAHPIEIVLSKPPVHQAIIQAEQRIAVIKNYLEQVETVGVAKMEEFRREIREHAILLYHTGHIVESQFIALLESIKA